MAMSAPTPIHDFGQWSRGNGLEIVLLVLGSILLARSVRWFSDVATDQAEARRAAQSSLVRSEDDKHRRALAQVVTWALVVVIYVVAAILIVQKLGVALAAFVPLATVAGVALGFGAQRIVQDLLAGFFVVAERQYGFGDMVRVSVVGLGVPVLGTVENVSLRTTTVRTHTGEVVITPNGQIAQITNLSRDWARAVIDVPVAATMDVNRVLAVLRAACETAFAEPSLHDLLLDAPSVMGVESIEVDQFQVRVVARTLPGRQFEVGRTMRVLITRTLASEGIILHAEISTGEPTGTA
ncbi:MAG: mechanosensitive ion channel family protein [Nocardioides sp.]|uniref:mechanosensitive ion channel family protein n=1 Tax=Nocardioides nematodiphilus TaxID=2849669 RepID=UPI001CD9FB03|nr:mechanosensitive ion channel family protein [Nocardioides nematodiphilus]MCA1982985.1 mechanosensitive ion channel family protein [Nocardioides nematodiphilus]